VFTRFIFLVQSRNQSFGQKNQRISYATQFLACLILLSSDATYKNEPEKHDIFVAFPSLTHTY
jgi:hypothetical protein|tara:strand:- start:1167 stop:1355 length:189 start_codon:yes stop_codon:yes gene_type:complete